jgi:hypothetical protein
MMKHVWPRIIVAAIALGVAPSAAVAQRAAHPACGTSIPIEEALGFVPLPRGHLFCPRVADPKEARSFTSYQRASREPFDTDIAAVGLGDSFGLVRWGGPLPGEGFQISIVGSIFAQFDLRTDSYDLINADYLIGLPLTFRRGGFSTRLRIYHQSSHLGDEYLLREQQPERENLAFEAVELILSQEVGGVRAYGGAEYLFNREPDDLAATVLHAGVELRQLAPLLRIGTLGSARLLAAFDVKSSEEQDWSPAISARAGLEVGRARIAAAPARRWSVLGEFYNGPTPYGQFFRDEIRYLGLGIHLTL